MIEQAILNKSVELFTGDVNTINLLGGFNENVFEFKRNDHYLVLKIYNEKQFNKSLIQGEVEWVYFLSQKGLNVTRPIMSINNQLVEELIVNDDIYYIITYEKAKGGLVDPNNQLEWNDHLFYNWGQFLGKMHKITKHYCESSPNIKRKEWDEEFFFYQYQSSIDKEIINIWNKHIETLKKFPKDKDVYGMVHNDLHHQNFHIDNNELIVLDFDGCQYNWFCYDIAIAIYHSSQLVIKEKRKEFTSQFTKFFLRGYLRENTLNDFWLQKINYFIEFRLIYSYMYFMHHLSEDQIQNQYKIMLDNLKEDILNNNYK